MGYNLWQGCFYNESARNYKNSAAPGRAILANGAAGITHIFLQVVAGGDVVGQSRLRSRAIGIGLALEPGVIAAVKAAAVARA
jgi:hypothetical protein